MPLRHHLAGASALLCLFLISSTSALADPSGRHGFERPMIVAPGDVLHSSSSYSDGAAKAATDTFYLYGGPGTPEGKFQDANGVIPDRQGWIGVDLTRGPVYWQVSDFNAANLNDNGAGNIAAWCGQTAEQQPGWPAGTGYGRNWDQALVFTSPPVADPSVGQTVDLDFFFNYEFEPGYDYFLVEYDSAGTWTQTANWTGTNKEPPVNTGGVFPVPGVQYSTESPKPIVYAGNDYAGPDADRIVLRLRFISDGAFDDETGLWPTDAGAVQVDDISVTWSDGTSFTDFEGGFDGDWTPQESPFAGDFSKVWPLFEDGDLDYCNDNRTPVMAFLDAGQALHCPPIGPPPPPDCSTEGTTSPTWSYGVPGGYVVNYNGGLGGEETPLSNEVWSPEIDWDLPGTDDDGAGVVGAELRFDEWTHFRLQDAIYSVWHVRSYDGSQWTQWEDRNFVSYGGSPAWLRRNLPVGDLLAQNPQKVQIALGVRDLADVFGLPGEDATPFPVYDNVALVKYDVGGPSILARTIDLANDGFPVGGGIDVSTPAARDGLDVPFDMARDVAWNSPGVDAGDSIICDITAVIPATEVVDTRMVWVLDKNPLFEDAIRNVPSRPKDVNIVVGAQQWRGEVLGDSSTTTAGIVIPGRFFFDLPDIDFLYPGDVLRYYLQATDDGGGSSTLPEDLTGFENGFENGSSYDRTFVVRALPSIRSEDGTQPGKLVWEDFGRGRGDGEWTWSMRELGFIEGVDYDTYSTQGPTSGVSNGLGSEGGHGATAAQLAGYDTIVHLAGNLNYGLLSDGSNEGSNDKSDDLALLTGWLGLPGDRNVVHFGNSIFSTPSVESVAGSDYVQNVLGAEVVDSNLRDDVDGQTAPVVEAIHPNFATRFTAFGGCPSLDQFDHVRPLPGAVRGHGFLDPAGSIYPGPAASILHERMVGGDRKVAVGFPFGFRKMWYPVRKDDVNTTVRTELLRETFDYLGVVSGGGVVSAPDLSSGSASMTVHPNPFNPATTVRFANLPAEAEGSVRVFNLRGELVRELHAGPFGDRASFRWDGTDANGASVASGVYLVEGRATDFERVVKVALVK